MLRLFLGIPLPAASRHALASWVAAQPPVAGLRWVPAANWHVTVHYLGAVRAEMLPNLRALMQVGLRDYAAFSLVFEGYVLAPKGREARMIWARYGRAAAYRELVQGVQRLCGPVVPPPQAPRKSPVPHVTLARLRPPAAGLALNLRVSPPPDLLARELVLWHSALRPGGAVYTELDRWPLRIS